LTAANAGHEYPAIKKKDGCFELYKDKHGFVIGGMENMRYKEYELQLDPGDKLFVYTDGVPEAMNGSNEMFGTERMISALNTCAGESPKTILQKVKRTVDAFVGDSKQFDDLTMMCLEYRGPVAGNGGEPAQPMGSSSDDLTP
jgi:sigma-B regulation protein RsbU (phosphoserine phosphatase)